MTSNPRLKSSKKFLELSRKTGLVLMAFWLAGVILVYPGRLLAQESHGLPRIVLKNKMVKVPFSYENGFIVINVLFQNVLPLRFIIDTGAEYSILTQKEISDLLKIPHDREYNFLGADLQTEIKGFLIRNIDLEIHGVQLLSRDMLVTYDDYFRINYFTGSPIHGIIGADILSRFSLSVDFQKKMLTFIDPDHFTPPAGYDAIPATFIRNKPYLTLSSQIHEKTPAVPLKYLMDTGAALGVLLLTDSHPAIQLPDQTAHGVLGIGLGGFIMGAKGRIRSIKIGAHELLNITGNFQDLSSYPDTSVLQGRKGLIGNLFLDRFDIILDYRRSVLYLKPNRNFENPFPVDRSGLFLLASGADLHRVVVQESIPGSPAHLADVRPGDIIRRYNGWPTSLFGLQGLNKRMRMEPGKKIRLTLRRGRTTVHRRFVLKDYI